MKMKDIVKDFGMVSLSDFLLVIIVFVTVKYLVLWEQCVSKGSTIPECQCHSIHNCCIFWHLADFIQKIPKAKQIPLQIYMDSKLAIKQNCWCLMQNSIYSVAITEGTLRLDPYHQPWHQHWPLIIWNGFTYQLLSFYA